MTAQEAETKIFRDGIRSLRTDTLACTVGQGRRQASPCRALIYCMHASPNGRDGGQRRTRPIGETALALVDEQDRVSVKYDSYALEIPFERLASCCSR